MIEYVADLYGREAVSQIITFGTMAAKAVVRDVARVQGKSYGLADRLSKMIPFEVGMTLQKAFEQEEVLRDFLATDEDAKEIWDMALKLEGITRGTGKHAGGVVIAPTKLTDFSPIACDEDGNGLVTQFDKDDVEQAGLVKFDFLGLRTLTIIKWALETINRTEVEEGREPLNIDFIPLDDKPTYALLQKAETTAVFQLESRGMKELIKKLKPDCLEDSSPWWRCSAPVRCSPAWWTTSSTASTAAPSWPIRIRTTSTTACSRCWRPPTALSSTRNR